MGARYLVLINTWRPNVALVFEVPHCYKYMYPRIADMYLTDRYLVPKYGDRYLTDRYLAPKYGDRYFEVLH